MTPTNPTPHPVEIETTRMWYNAVHEIYDNAGIMHDTGTTDAELMKYLFKSIETLRLKMVEDLIYT